MHPLLNIALKLARSSGNALSREFDRISTHQSENIAITTTIRAEVEAHILESLQQTYGSHGLVFPGFNERRDAETVWLIDVLSGAENFVRGIPHFAVCIAIQHQNKIEHALIHDPLLNETFSGSRTGQTQLNNFRVRINDAKDTHHAILAGNNAPKFEQNNAFSRQTGCNSLMLAYVANGRYDGFAGNGLSEFETAAGGLLVKASGGLYSDLSGGNDYLSKGELLAANPKLFKVLLQELRIKA